MCQSPFPSLSNSRSNLSSWKKGPAKSHPGLRKLCIRLEGKKRQNNIHSNPDSRTEGPSLCAFPGCPCQDLDAWWWIDCMHAAEDKNDLSWPLTIHRCNGLDLKYLILAPVGWNAQRQNTLCHSASVWWEAPRASHMGLCSYLVMPSRITKAIRWIQPEKTIGAGQKPRGQTDG